MPHRRWKPTRHDRACRSDDGSRPDRADARSAGRAMSEYDTPHVEDGDVIVFIAGDGTMGRAQ
jgi:hypothetical protein